MCDLCGPLFFQDLYVHTHTCTDISHPWPCEKMLYRLEQGVLKAWHITWLCTTSDSNHTWPHSTTQIILWICHGVLMLTVYPGFIIMTSTAHKDSADPARGLDGKQTKLPCRDSRLTVHHGQGQDALQFLKTWRYMSTHSLSWPFSK